MAGSVALAVGASPSRSVAPGHESVLVNDVHSQLNSTRVQGISQPQSLKDVLSVVRTARKDRKLISVAGGRHAMGGQQFGSDTLLIDVRKLNRVLNLDRKSGIIEVEAGIEWPELINGYIALQAGDGPIWGIAQKQTGADRLTIAGTIAANAHGRGLKMQPFVSDVESFVLVDATGTVRTCSRTENPELFRLVHGGYGLFGVVTSVHLRLAPRRKVERVVEIRGQRIRLWQSDPSRLAARASFRIETEHREVPFIFPRTTNDEQRQRIAHRRAARIRHDDLREKSRRFGELRRRDREFARQICRMSDEREG